MSNLSANLYRLFVASILFRSIHGLTQPSRRSILKSSTFGVASILLSDPPKAHAVNQSKPKEFVDVGTQAPPPDGESAFTTLDNGVKIKDFRVGSGDDIVQGNSQNVMIQCTGRLLNLNGVIFYSTKNNNPDGFGPVPLSLNFGKGEVLPGLESGIIGMKKGAIRRIIVPADLAYSKYPELEPKPTSANDQRALDSVVKNTRRDATIMFDVQVERFK
mmetsp:Transcript_6200/g.7852  ORF Transcript_6200/g.7852 Transcript_6200/m.7852 type:complete len:217 (-) Transcript_6200:29-679(-)